jgi:tRNA threonylcarbamoyladenosine modification (KEOPS) complex  Pcc1 subunit
VTVPLGPWAATIRVRRPDRSAADHLARALLPEASREVPRSRAALSRPDDDLVTLEVTADDTGALRAAMNAYLGWVRLALDAEVVAERAVHRPSPAKRVH